MRDEKRIDPPQHDGRRHKVALIVGGVLAGLLMGALVWRAWTTRGCRYDDIDFRVPLRETVGADGLRRYEPDGCHIDANGFRNPAVPERVDVVAVGDSNTWGGGSDRDSWPRVLERGSRLSVYNMSMPGWGPIDFLGVLPEVLKLHPRAVVIALYMGNDIYDAYSRLARATPALQPLAAAFGLPAEIAEDRIWQIAEAEAVSDGLNFHEAWSRADYEALERGAPERMTLLRIGSTDVYITPQYRLYGINLDEPRIAFGLGATKLALANIVKRTRAENARLVVVLLPSKEYVYCGLAPAAKVSPVWSAVCANEARIESELLQRMEELGIDHGSALGDLRKAAAAGTEIYPDVNTHPGKEGLSLFGEYVRRVVDGALAKP